MDLERLITIPVLGRLALCCAGLHSPPRRRRRTQAGQSTVEYALILLGAAAVALVVVAWVTRTDLIGRLFDTVVGRILQQAG
jgi:Flp pilus assembly pilin Flp